ncbi:MAG: FAD-dependent oxidoreductase [Ahniella sp.]|nr:FAD-dependent oxidoreductase [Ahniella sp.]
MTRPDGLPAKTDVVVIGAGVIGLSVAFALRKEGRDVVVLDRGRAGGGASHGNCGTLTPSHALPLAQPGVISKALKWMIRRDAPLYVQPRFDPALWAWLLKFAGRCNEASVRQVGAAKARLLIDSRVRLRDWIRNEQFACEFEERGQLAVYRDDRTFTAHQANADLLREFGIRIEARSGAEARRMSPGLRADVVAGHFYPGDAEIRPDRYVAELLAAARSLGVTVLENTAVDGFVQEQTRITGVRVEAHEIGAKQVVLASGVLAPQLAGKLGIKLPIQPGKGYSVTFTAPKRAPALPLVLRERAVCVTPWASGFRLGSTMEFSGLSERLNPIRIAALKRGAAEYLEEPCGPVELEQWYGFRPMTFDDLPIIGPAPRHEGLWLAAGHGMLGMSLSAGSRYRIGSTDQSSPPSTPKMRSRDMNMLQMSANRPIAMTT